MKKILLSLLIFTSSFVCAQETKNSSRTRKGEAAFYSSRDATTLSMMGWGLGLAVGIATLFALLDNNATADGGGGHTH